MNTNIAYALARSVIVLGRLIRSHIPAIVLNALINVLSELLIVRRLEYLKKFRNELLHIIAVIFVFLCYLDFT